MERIEKFKYLIAKEMAIATAQGFMLGMVRCGHDYDAQQVCDDAERDFETFLEAVEEIYDASGSDSRLLEAALAVPGSDPNVKS